MSETLAGLTPEECDLLRDMAQWYGQRKAELKHAPPHLGTAPHAYIVVAPNGGIAAYDPEPGTDTGSSVADVNYANCKCYRIDNSFLSDVDVKPISRTLPVWNLGPSAVTVGTIGLAVRDETGKWIWTPLSAGTSSGGLTFIETKGGNVTLSTLSSSVTGTLMSTSNLVNGSEYLVVGIAQLTLNHTLLTVVETKLNISLFSTGLTVEQQDYTRTGTIKTLSTYYDQITFTSRVTVNSGSPPLNVTYAVQNSENFGAGTTLTGSISVYKTK
jgi:hypothetical protein